MDSVTAAECVVCLDPFDWASHKPKLLPCLHAICLACLGDILNSTEDLCCPVCRGEIETGVIPELLPTPTWMILERGELLQRTQTTLCLPRCLCCLDKPQHQAIAVCCSCDLPMCAIAIDSHPLHGNIRFLVENYTSTQPLCTNHSEPLWLFCKTCLSAICHVCAESQHSFHEQSTLVDEASELMPLLQKNIESLRCGIDQLQTAETAVKNVDQQVSITASVIATEIDDAFDNLIARLIERKQTLCQILQTFVRAKHKALDLQASQLQVLREHYQRTVIAATSAIDIGSETEIVAVGHIVQSRCQTLLEHTASATLSPVESDSLRFSLPSNLDDFTRSLGQIRNVSGYAPTSRASGDGLRQATIKRPALFQVVVYARDGERCPLGGDLVTAYLEPDKTMMMTHQPPPIIQASVTDLGNGQYSVTYETQHSGSYNLHVAVNDEPINSSPFSVVVTERDWRSIRTPTGVFGRMGSGGPGMLKFPRGIVSTTTGNLFVADHFNHRLQIFVPHGDTFQPSRTIGSKGQSPGQFQYPDQLYRANDGSIWVADSGNDRIQCFNAEGVFIRQIASGPVVAVAVLDNGDIAIVDPSQHEVRLLGADGTRQTRFGRSGGDAGEFDFPSAIAAISSTILVVCDRGNHRLQVFQRILSDNLHQWHFVRQIGSHQEFDQPSSIAVSSEGFLIVTDSGACRVSVWTVYGQRLHVWGERGPSTQPGGFASPAGVAVLPSGQIAITDQTYHCVQVYKTI